MERTALSAKGAKLMAGAMNKGPGARAERAMAAILYIELRNFTRLSEMLDAEPFLIDARTGIGETPLHYLAVEDHLEGVRFLHQRGASLDVANDFEETPLKEALSLGKRQLRATSSITRPCVSSSTRIRLGRTFMGIAMLASADWATTSTWHRQRGCGA